MYVRANNVIDRPSRSDEVAPHLKVVTGEALLYPVEFARNLNRAYPIWADHELHYSILCEVPTPSEDDHPSDALHGSSSPAAKPSSKKSPRCLAQHPKHSHLAAIWDDRHLTLAAPTSCGQVSVTLLSRISLLLAKIRNSCRLP